MKYFVIVIDDVMNNVLHGHVSYYCKHDCWFLIGKGTGSDTMAYVEKHAVIFKSYGAARKFIATSTCPKPMRLCKKILNEKKFALLLAELKLKNI
jgi:hypothetical protein